MPFTEESKRRYLESHGLDPEKHDITDDYRIVEKQGRGEAFGRVLGHSILPSLVGLGGAAGGMKAGAALGTVIGTPGIGTAVGAIGGGLLGGLAGGLAQDKALDAILDDQTKYELDRKLFEARRQFPGQSIAAEILPSAIAFSPASSANVLKAAGRGLVRPMLTAGSGATAGERQALQTVLMEAGLGAGIESGFQAFDDQEGFQPSRIIGAALGETLLGEPNRAIGQRLGFQPVDLREAGLKTAIRNAGQAPTQEVPFKPANQQGGRGEYPTRDLYGQPIEPLPPEPASDLQSKVRENEQFLLRQTVGEDFLTGVTDVSDIRLKDLSLEEREIVRSARRGDEAIKALQELQAKSAKQAEAAELKPETQAEVDKIVDDIFEKKVSPEELEATRAKVEQDYGSAVKAYFDAEYEMRKAVADVKKVAKKVSVKDVVTKDPATGRPVETTGDGGTQYLFGSIDEPFQGGVQAVEEVYQPSKSALDQITKTLERSGRPGNWYAAENSDLRDLAMQVLQRRGILTLIRGTDLGGAIGRSNKRERVIDLAENPGLDTLFHEVFHIFNRDIERFGNQFQRTKLGKALKLAQAETIKYNRQNPDRPITAEEFLTELVGRRSAELLGNRRLGRRLGMALQDFSSRVKAGLGGETLQDLANLFARSNVEEPFNPRLLEDPAVRLREGLPLRTTDEYLKQPVGVTDGIRDIFYQGASRLKGWHVTSARFPFFDSSYMSSGEGFQTFGVGHYMTAHSAIRMQYWRKFLQRMGYDPKLLATTDTGVQKDLGAKLELEHGMIEPLMEAAQMAFHREPYPKIQKFLLEVIDKRLQEYHRLERRGEKTVANPIDERQVSNLGEAIRSLETIRDNIRRAKFEGITHMPVVEAQLKGIEKLKLSRGIIHWLREVRSFNGDEVNAELLDRLRNLQNSLENHLELSSAVIDDPAPYENIIDRLDTFAEDPASVGIPLSREIPSPYDLPTITEVEADLDVKNSFLHWDLPYEKQPAKVQAWAKKMLGEAREPVANVWEVKEGHPKFEPGVEKKDVEVSHSGEVLTFTAKKHEDGTWSAQDPAGIPGVALSADTFDSLVKKAAELVRAVSGDSDLKSMLGGDLHYAVTNKLAAKHGVDVKTAKSLATKSMVEAGLKGNKLVAGRGAGKRQPLDRKYNATDHHYVIFEDPDIQITKYNFQPESSIKMRQVTKARFPAFDKAFLRTGQGAAAVAEGFYFTRSDMVLAHYLDYFGGAEYYTDQTIRTALSFLGNPDMLIRNLAKHLRAGGTALDLADELLPLFERKKADYLRQVQKEQQNGVLAVGNDYEWRQISYLDDAIHKLRQLYFKNKLGTKSNEQLRRMNKFWHDNTTEEGFDPDKIISAAKEWYKKVGVVHSDDGYRISKGTASGDAIDEVEQAENVAKKYKELVNKPKGFRGKPTPTTETEPGKFVGRDPIFLDVLARLEPEKLIRWEKPIDKQHPDVQAAIQRILERRGFGKNVPLVVGKNGGITATDLRGNRFFFNYKLDGKDLIVSASPSSQLKLRLLPMLGEDFKRTEDIEKALARPGYIKSLMQASKTDNKYSINVVSKEREDGSIRYNIEFSANMEPTHGFSYDVTPIGETTYDISTPQHGVVQTVHKDDAYQTILREAYSEMANYDPDVSAHLAESQYFSSAERFYRWLTEQNGGNQRASSDELLAEGVKGVKYLADKGTRSYGDSRDYNFVIFDDKPLEIQQYNYQTGSSIAPDPKPFTRGVPLFRSVLDTIAKDLGKPGVYISNRFRRMFDRRDELIGRFMNKAAQLINESKLTTAQINEINRFGQEMYETQGNPSFTLKNDRQVRLYNDLRDLFAEARKQQNESGPSVKYIKPDGKVGYRKGQLEPHFWPISMAKMGVLDTLTNNPNTERGRKLKQEFLDWTKAQAKGEVNDDMAEEIYRQYFEQQAQHGTARFAGIRLEKGTGLPPSWREDDLPRLMQRWFRRYASDMAFYEVLESDPISRGALHIPDEKGDYDGNAREIDGEPFDPIGRSQNVQTVMDIIKNNFTKEEAIIDSANRLVKSFMMQTLTGAVDVASAPFLLYPHLPMRSVMSVAKGILQHQRGMKRALERGVALEKTVMAQEIVDFRDTISQRFNQMADAIYKWTGREYMEKVARGITMEGGYLAAKDALTRPNAKSTQELFDRFGPTNWRVKLLAGDGETLALQTAANLVRTTQGTYDVRGLPAFALKGKLSPIFSLAKWNIERANNFTKHIIAPMMDGNFKPFLQATVGLFLGGAAVEYIREQLTGHTNQWPSWREAQDIDDYSYKLAALASLSGFGGILADFWKSGHDISAGSSPQGFSFQLYDAVVNFFDRVQQARDAMDNGENPYTVMPLMVQQLLKDYVQNVRLAYYWADLDNSQRDKERFEQLRNLRMFEQGADYPVTSFGGFRSNPFLNREIREFKRDEDLKSAADRLGKTILPAILEIDNPERRQAELRGLSAMPLQTVPSPLSSPLKYAAYMKWLTETKGPDVAQKTALEYARQQEMNRAKRTLLPPAL